MKSILSTALGTATGSLVYTELLHKGPSLNWQRAVCIAIVAAVLTALWNRKKSKS